MSTISTSPPNPVSISDRLWTDCIAVEYVKGRYRRISDRLENQLHSNLLDRLQNPLVDQINDRMAVHLMWHLANHLKISSITVALLKR